MNKVNFQQQPSVAKMFRTPIKWNLTFSVGGIFVNSRQLWYHHQHMASSLKPGFSTGALYKADIAPISKQAITVMRELGCSAIELGCNQPERMKFLKDIEPADLAGFEYVSLHTPAISILGGADQGTRNLLGAIQAAHERLNLSAVVVHPDQVSDWSVFKHYSFPLAIENMDNRKAWGQTAADLRTLFAEHDFKMVLDLNHCHVNDATMNLAKELYSAFKERIVESHLSGHHHDLHASLYSTQQRAILEAIPTSDLPIILEGSADDASDLAKEYDYVRQYILGRAH